MIDRWCDRHISARRKKGERGDTIRMVGGEHAGKPVAERVPNDMRTADSAFGHRATNFVSEIVQGRRTLPRGQGIDRVRLEAGLAEAYAKRVEVRSGSTE